MIKLFEKMVSVRLLWLFDKGGFVVPLRYNFRHSSSATDALVQLVITIRYVAVHSGFFSFTWRRSLLWRYGILRVLNSAGLIDSHPLFLQS